MRILITGGAGFLGSHLCDYLLAKGHEIICMDNLITGTIDNISHIRSEKFKFYKYDVLGATYTELAPIPETVGEWTGARLTIIDGKIYFLHGGSAAGKTRNFWRYEEEENRWTPLLYPFSKGEGLSVVATQDRVFVVYGLTLASWDFLENSWSLLASPPEGAYEGACLTWDRARYLYLTTGSLSFYRFDLQNGTWTKLQDLPADLGRGSRIFFHKKKVYCTRGGLTNSFYAYEVENQKWIYLPSFTEPVGAGSDIA